MQAAGNMAAARKTTHEPDRISLLLQFINNALEGRNGAFSYVSHRARFCPHRPGPVLRPKVRLPIMMQTMPSMVPCVTDVMPDVVNSVMSLNVVRAMLVVLLLPGFRVADKKNTE